MLPRARIARVSWWRRLLARLRGTPLQPVVLVVKSEPMVVGAPITPWRCPPCLYRVGEVGCVFCRRDAFDNLGRNLGRVGYHLARPAPTAMPGPGERVSR